MIVLDTNVVSELMRAAPSQAVLAWLAAQPSASLFTTTITQAEVLFGVACLPAGRRRDDLTSAAEAMFEVEFAGRVLPFDAAAAQAFAPLAAERRRQGRPVGAFDVQVAAIAASRRASVATRNVEHFDGFGPPVVNPWTVPAP